LARVAALTLLELSSRLHPEMLRKQKLLLEAAAYKLLKRFSHRRNRLTEAEIAAGTDEKGYSPSKAKRHIDFFGKYVSFAEKAVLDIGSGYGDLCIGLAKAGATKVVGVDLDPVRIDCAAKNAKAEGVDGRVQFECVDFVKDYAPKESFDFALSIASFEHILDPSRCLKKIYDCLKPGGSLLTRFGPLWLSPYGAHMFDFTRIPWVHLFLPERVVLRVRQEYFRPDQRVERYEEIVGHLNRITVRSFKKCARDAGFEIQVFRVNPEKDWKWGGILQPFNSILNAVPFLRELGSLTLLAILKKP
jgi:SAM-dependent methyltransferase